ncbi:hypothetical protein SLS56_009142 [Neofusicoccum ribis]|uniref:Uncharacterized protein n=1 Tax=Neofusicoccum ribis TaxID=45134 RepID=A0ABR3SI22_9PEZI
MSEQREPKRARQACRNCRYRLTPDDMSTFRQRLEEGSLPSYLLFSFLAISTRFSDHAFFENRHAEAIECYARLGWAEIFEQSFSEDHNVDVFTVQAANMLAVIDFVRKCTPFVLQ